MGTNVRYKLSDGKLGDLSTIPNNNIIASLSAYIFMYENVSFRAIKASFVGSFALLLQCEEICN